MAFLIARSAFSHFVFSVIPGGAPHLLKVDSQFSRDLCIVNHTGFLPSLNTSSQMIHATFPLSDARVEALWRVRVQPIRGPLVGFRCWGATEQPTHLRNSVHVLRRIAEGSQRTQLAALAAENSMGEPMAIISAVKLCRRASPPSRSSYRHILLRPLNATCTMPAAIGVSKRHLFDITHSTTVGGRFALASRQPSRWAICFDSANFRFSFR
jgi:hypothetical protein